MENLGTILVNSPAKSLDAERISLRPDHHVSALQLITNFNNFKFYKLCCGF